MAYQFNGTNQRLSASAPVTAAPLTVACWFRAANVTHDASLITLVGSPGYFALLAEGAFAGDPVTISDNHTGPAALARTTAGFSANTWTHACGVRNSTTSRTVYLNGGNSATNTQSKTPLNINECNIGSFNSGALFLNGMIAEVGIWDAALTAAEIASLANGMTPDKIRPQSLVFYAPLVRDLIDQKGGRTITNNNAATVANHPRVYA
jgi:hypothetical protein